MDIILPDVFCNVDRPRPSQDVIDMYVTTVLEIYNVHSVKMGNKVFNANYVGVFIDIDQLKGKPMQNLVKNILCSEEKVKSVQTLCAVIL